jgi:hypothetical protein
VLPSGAEDGPSRARWAAGRVLAGLVLWLLLAGRWGSYVGWPAHSIYITELALVVVAVLTVASGPRALVERLRRAPPLVVLCAALFGVAVVRLVFSPGLSVTALRDFAPYGYSGVALLPSYCPHCAGRRRCWACLRFAR